VFGGTSEGRALAGFLRERNIPALICVATEYGEALLDAGGSVAVHTGRLDAAGMEALLKENAPKHVIDATHPYAAEVSRNIRAACEARGVPYTRMRRECACGGGFMEFQDMDALVSWLNGRPGVIFSALGAKEAAALARVEGFRERVWLRVLPSAEGLGACLSAGFPAKHVICMQGPFSEELNLALFRETGASILLTKESGDAGGFAQKLSAAQALHMTVAVLARPREKEGLSLDELERRIAEGAL